MEKRLSRRILPRGSLTHCSNRPMLRSPVSTVRGCASHKRRFVAGSLARNCPTRGAALSACRSLSKRSKQPLTLTLALPLSPVSQHRRSGSPLPPLPGPMGSSPPVELPGEPRLWRWRQNTLAAAAGASWPPPSLKSTRPREIKLGSFRHRSRLSLAGKLHAPSSLSC